MKALLILMIFSDSSTAVTDIQLPGMDVCQSAVQQMGPDGSSSGLFMGNKGGWVLIDSGIYGKYVLAKCVDLEPK